MKGTTGRMGERSAGNGVAKVVGSAIWFLSGFLGAAAFHSLPSTEAASVLVPHTFSPNTVAKAEEVNANFESLRDAVAELRARFEPSYLIVRGGNGIASAGSSHIRCFDGGATLVPGPSGLHVVGTAITYEADTVDGDRFVVNEDGVYTMTYVERITPASQTPYQGAGLFAGIIVNATANDLITATHNFPTDRMAIYNAMLRDAQQEQGLLVTLTLPLQAGDVIRAHVTNLPNVSARDHHTFFCVTRVN